MNDISSEIKDLLIKYEGNRKTILKINPNLDYLYALSDMRENLLEWYPFKEDASLLQIGSDYGALTGLYSRKVKTVTVLDPVPANLEVNKFRYMERENIRYVEGMLESFSEGGFDYIVMVGSLGGNYEKQIEKAKSLLSPEGVLILAVCNKLGLKYQAGAKADSVCLLRETLRSLLKGGEFYYPMPDYRLPITLYSDSHLPVKGDLTHQVIAYDYPEYLKFDLGKMYDDVCEAKQFESFANSFLVIWSSHEED